MDGEWVWLKSFHLGLAIVGDIKVLLRPKKKSILLFSLDFKSPKSEALIEKRHQVILTGIFVFNHS